MMSGLKIFDVHSPSHPRLVSQSVECKYATDVVVTNGFAWIADSTNGLIILNVEDPSRPIKIGALAGGSPKRYANGIVVSSNTVYMSNDGLDIIDVGNPSNPQRVGIVTLLNSTDIAVSGNYAYLTAGTQGLQIFDVSNPSSPRRVAIAGNGYIYSVCIGGDYACLAGGNSHLQIIDIHDPHNPVPTGVYFIPWATEHVAVQGNYVFVSWCGGCVLEVVDVSDPANPRGCGRFSPLISPNAIALEGHYAWVADGDGGLAAFGLDPPGQAARQDPAFVQPEQ